MSVKACSGKSASTPLRGQNFAHTRTLARPVRAQLNGFATTIRSNRWKPFPIWFPCRTARFGDGDLIFGFVKTLPHPTPELTAALWGAVNDVPDFPKPGIAFKDLAPLWANAELNERALTEIVAQIRCQSPVPDAVVGLESRGFIYGMAIAMRLGIPFIPMRKKGKLPGPTAEISYDLEYGQAILECQSDAFQARRRYLLHDDVLATGGTAAAATQLIQRMKGEVSGFSFVLELVPLQGKRKLANVAPHAYYHTLLQST